MLEQFDFKSAKSEILRFIKQFIRRYEPAPQNCEYNYIAKKKSVKKFSAEDIVFGTYYDIIIKTIKEKMSGKNSLQKIVFVLKNHDIIIKKINEKKWRARAFIKYCLINRYIRC